MKAFLIIAGVSILLNIVLVIIDAIHKAKHEKFMNEHIKELMDDLLKK